MRKCFICILLTILLLQAACWDWQDIESRGYVLGVAIDSYPPLPGDYDAGEEQAEQEEEAPIETMETYTADPKYAMTIQFPIIAHAALGSVPDGGGGSGADVSKTWEITQIGNSFMEINRRISTRTNFTPFYEHMKVIVISEDVAREGLDEILDFFIRDHEMRRRTRIFITPGEAKKILDTDPRIEDYSSSYLNKLPMNATSTSRLAHKTDLGQVSKSINSGTDFILPRVVATKDELHIGGVAVFKGTKMVGWLGELETISLKMIRNLYLGGVITTTIPDHEGIATLEVTSLNTKITPIIEGNNITFKTDINIVGNYAENLYTHIQGELDQEYLEKVSAAFATSVRENCIQLIKRIQEEFDADILHYGTILKTREPEYWEQIEDRWHEIFRHVECDTNVEVTIRQIGNVR